MPVYSLLMVDAPHIVSGGARGSLTTATSRTLTMNKNDVSACTWTMLYKGPDGKRSDESKLVRKRTTDVIVYRAEAVGDTPHALFRGRVKTSEVDFDEDGNVTVQIGASDYKWLLSRRLIDDGDCTSDGSNLSRNYAVAADLGSIVWDLVSFTQAKATEANLGINASLDGLSTETPTAMTTTTATLPSSGTTGTVFTGGSGNTGLFRSTVTQFAVGTSVADAINALAAGDPSSEDNVGFDWDILPDDDGTLRIHIWPLSDGGRGATSGYILDYPGVVASGSVQDDVDNFATAVRAAAGSGTSATYLGGATSDGLFESAINVDTPDTTSDSADDSGLISAAAAGQYYSLSQVTPSFALNIKSSGWHYGDSDLGDTVTVAVPWLEDGDSTLQLVLTQTYTIGDDGGELIAVTLGAPPLFNTIGSARRQLAMNRRIARLERKSFGGSA